jgi:hypothetical protein
MRSTLILTIACLSTSTVLPSVAADEPERPKTAPEAANAEAEYTRALEKRASDVLDVLKLDDPAKAGRVREAVIAQYRGLRDLHDARDLNIKSVRGRANTDRAELDGQIRAERERTDGAALALHEQFIARLSTDLSPDQVDRVKDKMTYNKLQVTYNAYLEMLPDLTPEQQRRVHAMLKEARDKAVYAGSADEKSEIFNSYKGRINNYLSAQGYDLALASKQWAERRKRAN